MIRKIIKESIDDFEWARSVPEPIKMPKDSDDYDAAEWKILKKLIRNGELMGDIEFMSGTYFVSLDGFNGPISVYATPHFSEFGFAPVDVHDVDDDIDQLGDIKIPKFDYVEQVEDFYINKFTDLIKQELVDNGYMSYVRHM